MYFLTQTTKSGRVQLALNALHCSQLDFAITCARVRPNCDVRQYRSGATSIADCPIAYKAHNRNCSCQDCDDDRAARVEWAELRAKRIASDIPVSNRESEESDVEIQAVRY